MPTSPLNLLGLFLSLAGFVIGLGAVTVIDLHGFLARKSKYWTLATTRAHKVTKPLIWVGTILVNVGFLIFFRESYRGLPAIMFLVNFALILNGLFLSFAVSPYMLDREKKGQADKIMPAEWQAKIAFSFVVSVLGWWGNLLLFSYHLISK